jgi:hypothetical protein
MLHLQDEVMHTKREVLKITDDLHLASFPNRKPTEHPNHVFKYWSVLHQPAPYKLKVLTSSK